MTNYKYHSDQMEKIVFEFAKTDSISLQRFLLDISQIYICRETGRAYIGTAAIRYPDLMALILAYHKTKDLIASPRYGFKFDEDCPESRNYWYFIRTYWPQGDLAYESAKNVRTM
jgi:hypothetical protein